MAGFEESRFLEAAQEIDSIKLEEYEFFTESVCESVECKIYRKYDPESGLYEYKIIGFLCNISPEVCKAVYMDLDYRRIWDDYVKDLHEVEGSGIRGIYWNVNYPFPMSNRDRFEYHAASKYTFIRELRELEINGSNIVVVLAHSHPLSSISEKSGVIRVTDYHQSLTIKSDGKGGTKAFMHYFDNPRGMIPSWLINWAAKTGVPSFMTSMHKACVKYPKYLDSKKKRCP